MWSCEFPKLWITSKIKFLQDEKNTNSENSFKSEKAL